MDNQESVAGSTVGRPGNLNIKILLGIVALALACKLIVFWLSVGTSMGLSLPNAENWQDYGLAYVPAVDAFRSGFLPYVSFYYPYPPLFLYALTAFSYLPLPSWSSALPLVAADALTVIPVYLIARELVSEQRALMISILFVLAPTNLYYVDYLWLNPSLTTLFLMTSIYFLIKRHYGLSALALALSIGFKQTALLALPVVLLVMWGVGVRRREPLKYLLLVASICLLFSLPYIVVSPTLYLDSVFRVPFGLWPTQVPQNYFQIGVGAGTLVTFDTSNWITSMWQLVASGINSPVTLALPVFIFLIPSAYSWIYNSSYVTDVLWLGLLGGYAYLMYVMRKKPSIDRSDSLNYVLYALLLLFAFYPLYKYYAIGLIPIFVLLVRSKKGAVGFVGFNLVFLLMPRYLASWVLLVAFVWLLRRPLVRRMKARPRSSVELQPA